MISIQYSGRIYIFEDRTLRRVYRLGNKRPSKLWGIDYGYPYDVPEHVKTRLEKQLCAT